MTELFYGFRTYKTQPFRTEATPRSFDFIKSPERMKSIRLSSLWNSDKGRTKMHVSFLVAISLIAAPFIQDLDEAKDATDFRVNLWSLDTGEKYYTTANIACVATVKFLGRSRPEAVLVDSTLVEVKGNDLVIRQSAIGHCHKLGDDDTVLSVIADLKPPENIKPGYYVVIVTVTDRHNGVRYVDSDSTLIRLVPRPDRVKRE